MIKDGNQINCLCMQLTNRILELYKYLQDKGEKIFSDRLMRSGLEIGVRLSGAQNATGFIGVLDRLEVALLHTNDTLYWLDILYCNNHISAEQVCLIQPLCIQIRCHIMSLIYTLKAFR